MLPTTELPTFNQRAAILGGDDIVLDITLTVVDDGVARLFVLLLLSLLLIQHIALMVLPASF